MRSTQARKLLAAVQSKRGRKALRHGVAATGEHAELLRRLAPTTVLDVGANRGQFALDVERALPSARVYSYEPIAAAASTYRAVFSNAPRCSVRQVALGATRGREVLHVSRHDDSSSLLPIGDGQTTAFPGTEEASTIEVEVSTLDDELQSLELTGPVLLKMDVQGFELEVLRGAVETLGETEWVYVEASFVELYDGQPLAADLIEWLRLHDFVLVDLGSITRVGARIVQADLLFQHRKRPGESPDTTA